MVTIWTIEMAGSAALVFPPFGAGSKNLEHCSNIKSKEVMNNQQCYRQAMNWDWMRAVLTGKMEISQWWESLKKSTVLDFNVGTKTIEIFPGPSKAVLVEIGTTSRLFRFLSTKIGFLFYLLSWQLYNHAKFVKKVQFSNILMQVWLRIKSLQII